MATLEKIRSKSVLLVSVIGFALVLFIITLVDNPFAMFQDNTTIAKVGSNKIEINDFQKRYEAQSQQMQQQNYKQDAAVVQQQVLNQMIQETLFNEEMNELGLTVTDSELTNAMLGANALESVRNLANQLGFETPDQFHDLAFNPTKYQLPVEQAQQLQQMWIAQENEVESMLKFQKLGNLFNGTLVANKLDAEAIYNENASTSRIAYAKKDFTSLPDDKYEVTDADLKALWAENKEEYKIDDETRVINYISVNITPSQSDNVAAQQLVEQAIADLKAQPGTEGLNGNVNFVVEHKTEPAYRIKNAQMKQFVTTATEGDASMTSYLNNEYTITKLIGSKNDVDSINIDMLAFQGTVAQGDSLIKVLNSGAAFDEVAKTAGVQGSQADFWASLINEQADNNIKQKLISAPVGTYFMADSAQNMMLIYRVNQRKAPVAVYNYATAVYKAEPSTSTYNKFNGDLKKFLDATASATDFTAEKAAAAGFQVFPAVVSSSSPMIGNVNESRDAVKWVMDSEKGDVSDIFVDEQGKRLLAVAVTDIYNDYIPATDSDVKQMLTTKARNNKKAADLLSQYQGKANTIAEYAALMETHVDSTDVTFGQLFIPRIGSMESVLTGQVSAAQPNKVMGPIQANNSVIVYEVINVDKENRPYNYEESAQTFNRSIGAQALSSHIFEILSNGKEIENRMLKFYSK
ncbi:MAG: SurA N-terminal domain-containing protein [Muribaculaceae bacterium]|nr:SurA N-terminal domain-containing protein [Muribaculaceae bacterium]